MLIFGGCDDEKKHAPSKFSDLPKSEQNKYISRSELSKFAPYLITTNQEIAPIDEPISDDISDLKMQVEALRAKNQRLFADNAELANKNLDLIDKFREQESVLNAEQKAADARNMQVLNEIEKQHYQNVSDLTRKINEAQIQNTQNAKNYEQKIAELAAELKAAQDDLAESRANIDLNVSAALKEQNARHSVTIEENNLLTSQIETLKSASNVALAALDAKLAEKNLEVERLKDEIAAKNNKYNENLAANTAEIVDLQTKTAAELARLESQIKLQKDEFASQIGDKIDEIARLKDELAARRREIEADAQKEREEIIKNERAKFEIETSELRQNYAHALEEQNATLARLEGEKNAAEARFNEILASKDKNFADALEAIKQKAREFQGALTAKQNEFDKNISNLNEALAARDAKIAAMNAKIEELTPPDAKTLENYAILNDKITNLTRENASLKEKLAALGAQNSADAQESALNAQKRYYEGVIEAMKNPQNKAISALKNKELIAQMSCKSENGDKLSKTCLEALDSFVSKCGAECVFVVNSVVRNPSSMSADELAKMSAPNKASALCAKTLEERGAKVILGDEGELSEGGYGFSLKAYK